MAVEPSPASSPAMAPGPPSRTARLRAWAARHERRLWAGSMALLLLAAVLQPTLAPKQAAWTMEEIDAALRKSIDENP